MRFYHGFGRPMKKSAYLVSELGSWYTIRCQGMVRCGVG